MTREILIFSVIVMTVCATAQDTSVDGLATTTIVEQEAIVLTYQIKTYWWFCVYG